MTACAGGGGGSSDVAPIGVSPPRPPPPIVSPPPPPPPPPPTVAVSTIATTINAGASALGDSVQTGVTSTTTRTSARPRGTIFAPTVSRDPATGTYTVDGFGKQIFPSSSLISNTGGISTYRNTGGATNYELQIVNPGATANGLTLTYATYGLLTNLSLTRGSTTVSAEQDFLLFGNDTPFAQRPRTGTGTYTGIAQGRFDTATTAYGLTGNLNVVANFGADTVTTNIVLAGTSLSGPATSIDFGTLSGTAAIASFRSTIGGVLQPGFAGFQGASFTSTLIPTLTGSYSGAFFGPAAEEVGVVFVISIPGTGVTAGSGGGIAVGKLP